MPTKEMSLDMLCTGRVPIIYGERDTYLPYQQSPKLLILPYVRNHLDVE